MKKVTLIVLILSAGCTSISNLKEVDFGITGLEMEFYPSVPTQPDITLFNNRALIDSAYHEKKNSQQKVNNPKLMPLGKK
tara:strand:- start:64 stop:303 length:240 start_codon:yes stop_codon:yes gene_type:complete